MPPRVARQLVRLVALLAALLAALLVAVGSAVGLAGAPVAATIDRDCADFATQAAAQAFMLASGAGDPHGLDGSDDDGLACEANPCPCGSASTPQPFAGNTGGTETGGGAEAGGGQAAGGVRRDVGTVVTVTDGDTLEVRVRGVGVRDVRILGIDTPEVHGRVECGGRQASRRMRGLAPVGSTVTLVSDPSQDDRDRYGRLLRYVERAGRDVGRAQVRLGLAKVYVHDHDPFRRTAGYRRVQGDARSALRGSWNTCWS